MEQHLNRRPILLIANPVSGGRPGSPPALTDDADALEPEALARALRDRGLEVDLHVLQEDDDAAALASRAARDGQDVVVAGGDGTVGPVAGALAGTDATLGILATGSWNNVARGAGVPDELDGALDALVRGEVARIDVGLAWHGESRPDDRPPADAVRFFEAAGIGLDAAGFSAVQLRERRGTWAAIRALWRALRRRRTPVRVDLDGREVRTMAPAVTVLNGPYHGMGFALVPEADASDGMLDVAIFSRMTQFQTVRHFLGSIGMRHRREPRMRTFRARHVVVRGARRTLPAHADGRSIGATPTSFAVEPGALRVFR